MTGWDNSGWSDAAANYDPVAVNFYDIAHEGAQLRMMAGFLASGAFDELKGMRPRSLVVYAKDETTRNSVEVAVSELEPVPFPISVVTQLPDFVGPLDVVLVASQSGADPVAEHAVSVASSRGSATILLAPESSPLVEDAGSKVLVIPSLPGVELASPMRVISTVLGIVWIASGNKRCAEEQMELLADLLDAELQRVAPDRDEVVNPARALRDFVADARVIHTAREPQSSALARLVATLWTASGTVSSYLDFDELVLASPKLSGGQVDIFYDPFEDESPAVLPLKIVVWGADEAGLPNAIAQNVNPQAADGTEKLFRLLIQGLAATAMPQ